MSVCFFQAEDGIRDLVRSRGLGDVYKRQRHDLACDSDGFHPVFTAIEEAAVLRNGRLGVTGSVSYTHLTLPTSDLV